MSNPKSVEQTKTPQQKLAHVAEECAEFLLAYMKYQRFGMWSPNYNNFDDMMKELDDIQQANNRFREYVHTSTPDQRRKDFSF